MQHAEIIAWLYKKDVSEITLAITKIAGQTPTANTRGAAVRYQITVHDAWPQRSREMTDQHYILTTGCHQPILQCGPYANSPISAIRSFCKAVRDSMSFAHGKWNGHFFEDREWLFICLMSGVSEEVIDGDNLLYVRTFGGRQMIFRPTLRNWRYTIEARSEAVWVRMSTSSWCKVSMRYVWREEQAA